MNERILVTVSLSRSDYEWYINVAEEISKNMSFKIGIDSVISGFAMESLKESYMDLKPKGSND